MFGVFILLRGMGVGALDVPIFVRFISLEETRRRPSFPERMFSINGTTFSVVIFGETTMKAKTNKQS